MRIIGIDLGEKRIGIAVTDKLNKIASPLTVIDNNSDAKEKILKIIKQYNAGEIVIGVPYNLKGEAGYQADIVNCFIEKNLKDLNLPLTFIDERYTSKIAENYIAEVKNLKKKQGKKYKAFLKSGDIDKLSAAILLDEYIRGLKIIRDKKNFNKK